MKKIMVLFFHMAAQKAASRILDRIRKRGPGAVWIPSDFGDLGTRRAVDGALHRLNRAGKIRRLARGLYDRPAANSRFGPVPPPIDAIVAAIARRTGGKVQEAGDAALNRLGLSTQVPAVATYITDGPSRRVTILGRPIVLRHASDRRLVAAGEVAGAVLEALRALGSGALDETVIARLRRVLDDMDIRQLERISPSATGTQRKAIARILRNP